ncbi:aKG-HExxH-type peptide beta-hydroxylase [Trinickia fusca]|uniref:aKG-HExxH-type peptide beta-hydroxylase n=1 Tax=Trinickia fusca TaxID=2419777 RepID=UPI0016045AD2|nr:HEXXH motif-containing putative peptide modification protein [Trinickia fusca]
MSTFDSADVVEAFATPAGSVGASLAGALASAYLDAIHAQVRAALERTNVTPGCRFEVLDSGLQRRGNAWRPECGLVLEALKRGHTVRAAAQSALALAAVGRQLRFDAIFEQPTRLFIDGYVFEVSGRTHIATLHDAIEITINDTQYVLRFSFDAGRWRATSETALSSAIIFGPIGDTLGHTQTYALKPSSEAAQDDRLWSLCESRSHACVSNRTGTRAEQDDLAGLTFVDQFAPSYASWNRPVSCGALLQRPVAGEAARSSSACSRPGLIYLSEGTSASLQGELFVHENAHQHLMLYGLFVPLTHKGDTNEYYSPIKGQRRNTERTLFAVHAIGNMLLYYHEAFHHGADLVSDMPRIKRYLEWFDQIKRALSGSSGLTASGHRLLASLAWAVETADVSWAT